MENIKIAYCPRCERDVVSFVQTIPETYPVKGEAITIEAQARICRCCGTDVWDEDLDPRNLEKAYSIYRQKHGLAPNAPLRN